MIEDDIICMELTECEYTGDCDFCEKPEGKSYCKESVSENGTECLYVICEKCLKEIIP